MSVAKKQILVKVSSGICGLHQAVHKVFASSPLSAQYDLKLVDLKEAGEAEIVLADPGKVASFLDSVTGLKWLQSTWAGINALGGVKRRDYICTRLSGCFGQQMAQYTIGAIASEWWLDAQARQAKKEWAVEPLKKKRRFEQQTLGCLGVGDISSVIGQRAQAFGMKTIGFATKSREVSGFDAVTTDMSEVLCSSDVLVNVLPSTPNTRGLLDNGVLQSCGEGKMFINVGRGDVVAEESLLEALDKGWISRAVLDVFAVEPLPQSSKLWSHPCVQVTPHVSAVTFPEDAAEAFVENLALWLEDKPLKYIVDLDKGY